MEQNSTDQYKSFFGGVIANPSQISAAHAEKLDLMIEQYPQSSVLHALRVKIIQDQNSDLFKQKLTSASAYAPNRVILHHLINQPEKLITAAVSQIVSNVSFKQTPAFTPAQQQIDLPPQETFVVFDPQQNEAVVTTATPSLPDNFIDDEIYDEIVGIDDIRIEPAQLRKPVDIPDFQKYQLELLAQKYPEVEEDFAELSEGQSSALTGNVTTSTQEQPPLLTTEATGSVSHETPQPVNETITNEISPVEEIADTLAPPVIKQKVHYVHLPAPQIVEESQSAPVEASKLPALQVEETAPSADQNKADETNNLSKYNDDKMPYSFMWWLDKTRKEYAANNRPYAENAQVVRPPKGGLVPNELQQQYYENIFYATTVEQLGKKKNEQFAIGDGQRKEDLIIERFIHEEPQMKPQAIDKIDNENKASKSAEDQDELVTETLAKIYMDQMLYHKAISSYQKLILKFPEKSTYFAAQIQLLESKI